MNAPYVTPFFTADLPGIGGKIRHRASEFAVTEIPLYEPCGEGDHVYVNFTKRNRTTHQVINEFARRFDLRHEDIGVAGMKDSRADTTQTISIPGVDPKKARSVKFEDVTVNWARRHNNKLKMGHLRGNRFSILIRDCEMDWEKAETVAAALRERGCPNGFGPQRFGIRELNHVVGKALIEEDWEIALDALLGTPRANDPNAMIQESRKAYEDGDLKRALELCPDSHRTERTMLESLIAGSSPKKVLGRIQKNLARLYIHAYQSELFNRVLAERLERGWLETLVAGDLAMKHENGAFFRVEDAAAEQPRCDRLEVSPTGPLVGFKTRSPEGEVMEMERAVLGHVDPEDFRRTFKGLTFRGERRALRIPVPDLHLTLEHDAGIRCEFSLPRGSFATSVLREIMKVEPTERIDVVG
jgi:tRNA pseudouridine13 synthase